MKKNKIVDSSNSSNLNLLCKNFRLWHLVSCITHLKHLIVLPSISFNWKLHLFIENINIHRTKLKISETIKDMEAYEKLTDSILEKILQSKKGGLEKSREILRRVQKRNLYKSVDKMDPKQSTKTDSELKVI